MINIIVMRTYSKVGGPKNNVSVISLLHLGGLRLSP
jgi:hypothetical protein